MNEAFQQNIYKVLNTLNSIQLFKGSRELGFLHDPKINFSYGHWQIDQKAIKYI